MNYKESSDILNEVKKAKRILLNCHRGPDADSVGSALAMRRVLSEMGKSVTIVCPDSIPSDSKFLKSSDVIKRIDFDSFDFSDFDLFIILDSSDWSQVLGFGKEKVPQVERIVIDHHYTNDGFGKFNIVDPDRSSTGEVLWKLFEDWDKKINKEVAEDLLTGIIYDTSCLEHPSADVNTVETTVKLMKLGANKNQIVSNLFRNIKFGAMLLIGEVIKKMQIDVKGEFVWSAVPYEDFLRYPDSVGAKSMAAGMFASSIEGANFGIIMIEEKKNFLNVSFRAKIGFDISRIAKELGGGGHKQSGATIIRNMAFDKAVDRVLEVARKYAKKTSSRG